MCLADIGLIGLYVADCAALAAIAETLGRNEEHRELVERAGQRRSALRSLWNEEFGLFWSESRLNFFSRNGASRRSC